MSRRLTRPVPVLLAAALALSAAGCSGDDPVTAPTARSASPSASASPSPSPSPSPTRAPSPTPAVQTSAVAVYYVGQGDARGPRLYREFHRRPVSDQAVRDAVEAMLEEEPADGDYRSLWAPGTGVNDVTVEEQLATVDLTATAATPSPGSQAADAAATLQQLVHTVTAAEPSVRRVQLLVDGQPVDRFWGAVDAGAPIGRAPAAEVLAPVWLLEPTEGATLARGDSFGGEASVFEATVNWEWVQGGTVVASGFSSAAEGAPGRGPWSAKVDVPPGDYELRAFESSAEDGAATYVDSKQVTVTG